MSETLTLEYPKHMEITNGSEAADAILYMCNDCVHQNDCRGERAAKCNEVKQQIKEFAMNNFEKEEKPVRCYDRIVISSQPSNKPNSLHGCEPIYILSAVDIREKTNEELQREFEVMKLVNPIWKDRTYQSFLTWKADFHETKFEIETYDTAYFLNPATAQDYAEQNMADINESGSYPYLVIYTRPTDHMYAEANPCSVTILEYNKDNDKYHEVTDIGKDIKYQYIRAKFDMFYKLPKEEV